MIERPNLTDDEICAGLRAGYGLHPHALEFLPVGNDATAWAFSVMHGPVRYFLKVKQGAVYEPALRVPRLLRAQGLTAVIPPLATQSGGLWQPLGDYNLILYPFVAGRAGMDQGLTPEQWTAFGALLRRIHAAALPADLLAQLPRETFRPWWAETVRRLDGLIASQTFQQPLERELAQYWRSRSAEILRITARAEELGRRAQSALDAPGAAPLALCHADIHTANLLIDPQGHLFVVDWDQTLLAPLERDLMFFSARPDGPTHPASPEEARFYTGYGPVKIQPVTLAYYQYEWVVQEIGDYGQRVFLSPELGEETRADAVRGFIQLFAPGDVVEGALGSEGYLR